MAKANVEDWLQEMEREADAPDPHSVDAPVNLPPAQD